jgi:hypothetical protein
LVPVLLAFARNEEPFSVTTSFLTYAVVPDHAPLNTKPTAGAVCSVCTAVFRVVMSAALPFTPVTMALKLAFTSAAFAGVPELNVLGSVTVPAAAEAAEPASARPTAKDRIVLRLSMVHQLQFELSQLPESHVSG